MKIVLNIPKYKTAPLLICILFTVQTNYAQQLTMSSMGILENTSSLSAAINFKSNANCIDVQSGIAVFNGFKGYGEFVVNCSVKQQFNMLGVKMFPNPVTTISKIKFTSTPTLTENFNITIWNSQGEFIKSLKGTGYNIFQGLLIDFSTLTPGAYILQIESPEYIEALKFIKAN
jgi:hypothetical protein